MNNIRFYQPSHEAAPLARKRLLVIDRPVATTTAAAFVPPPVVNIAESRNRDGTDPTGQVGIGFFPSQEEDVDPFGALFPGAGIETVFCGKYRELRTSETAIL